MRERYKNRKVVSIWSISTVALESIARHNHYDDPFKLAAFDKIDDGSNLKVVFENPEPAAETPQYMEGEGTTKNPHESVEGATETPEGQATGGISRRAPSSQTKNPQSIRRQSQSSSVCPFSISLQLGCAAVSL